jgi:hypothetical protein
MTIQAALAGGVEGEPIRRKLIALRVKEQDALRRRFERANSLMLKRRSRHRCAGRTGKVTITSFTTREIEQMISIDPRA